MSRGAKQRLVALVEGAMYGAVAATAISVAVGGGSGSSGGSGGSGGGGQAWTARVLSWPGGQFLVGLVGVVIVGASLFLIYDGWQAKFTKELNLRRVRPTGRRVVVGLGRFGRIARGVAFAIIGALVVTAAVTFDPGRAKGLDGALKTLAGQPYGPWLLSLVAIGLLAYGLYCLIESRLRRIG